MAGGCVAAPEREPEQCQNSADLRRHQNVVRPLPRPNADGVDGGQRDERRRRRKADAGPARGESLRPTCSAGLSGPRHPIPGSTTRGLRTRIDSMFEAVFQFLFKYRPLVFQQADFMLGASRPMLTAILLAAGAAAYAAFTYFGVAKARGRDRIVLVALRAAAVALVVFCLFRPTLILKAAVPQQNFLGIVLDDSRSMQIADRQNQPRSDFVHRTLGPDGGLLKA